MDQELKRGDMVVFKPGEQAPLICITIEEYNAAYAEYMDDTLPTSHITQLTEDDTKRVNVTYMRVAAANPRNSFVMVTPTMVDERHMAAGFVQRCTLQLAE